MLSKCFGFLFRERNKRVNLFPRIPRLVRNQRNQRLSFECDDTLITLPLEEHINMVPNLTNLQNNEQNNEQNNLQNSYKNTHLIFYMNWIFILYLENLQKGDWESSGF